jgi:hypothetical protein
MNINLEELSIPQLREIRRVIVTGVSAQAEADDRSYLCHKSPPKGYPKEKSEYGDPECYRYPLNTKSRCLAAWRYVHHADNKTILSGKFKRVESKIKSYAKSHYDLDLQVGESDAFDWAQAFVEYYDAETMGERCENIVLESDALIGENKNMNEIEQIAALEAENANLKKDKETLTSEKANLEGKASQVDSLTQELNNLKNEVETLRLFKVDTEKAAERANRISEIKAKLVEAGIESNLDNESEAKYWLDMSEETFKLTVSKMVELKKEAKTSASVKIPNLSNASEEDPAEVVRTGLRKMKEGK